MFHISLNRKIVFLGLALSIIFCIVFGLVFFLYLNGVMVKKQVENIEQISVEQSNRTLSDISRYQNTVNLIGKDKKILEFLNYPTDEKNVELDKIFHDYVDDDEFVLSLYLINKEGKTLVSTDKTFVGQNYGFREYFKSALLGVPYLEASLGKTSNKFGYYFSNPIFSPSTTVEGVLVIKINEKYFEKSLLEGELVKNSSVMIVDNFGVVMISSEPSRFLSSLGNLSVDEKKKIADSNRFLGKEINPLQYQIIQNAVVNYVSPTMIKIYDETDDDEESVYVHKIGDSSFFLIVETQMESIKNEIINILSIIVLAIIILFFLILIIGYSVFTKFIINPIKKLHNAAEKITLGDYTTTVDIKTNDELGELGGSFNKMSVSLNANVIKLKQYASELENKVNLKTKDLQDKVEDLKKTREAVLNVAEDIEIQKESILLEKDKLNTILHSIGDGVVVVDEKLNIIMCNEVAEKISGFSSDELVGKKYSEVLKFIFEDSGLVNDDFIKKTIKLGKIGEMGNKTVLIRKNGTKVPVADSAAPLKDLSGKIIGCVVVFRDATQEREIDKMKTEFISVASHQLRTPLTAIKLFAEMLVDNEVGVLAPKQMEYVKDIHESTERMVRLVNDLLNVSRLETGRLKIDPKLAQIEKMIADTVEEFKFVAKAKNSEIIYRKPKKLLPKMLLDDVLTRQIFHNLISNSLKYAKDGKGLVEVNLTTTDLSPDLITTYPKQFAKLKEAMVVLKVSDNGIGIPEAVQPKIFEKFFRADNAVLSAAEGTGLGLYICKMIVEASGGRIWFESLPEKGTTFFVSLPLKGMVKRDGEKSLA